MSTLRIIKVRVSTCDGAQSVYSTEYTVQSIQYRVYSTEYTVQSTQYRVYST